MSGMAAEPTFSPLRSFCSRSRSWIHVRIFSIMEAAGLPSGTVYPAIVGLRMIATAV